MVRVGTPSAVARPEWYDRNPIHRLYGYSGNLAPHSVTTRWTYTVPAGKKAFLELAAVHHIKTAAATTVVNSYSSILITPSGGSLTELIAAQIYTNAVGDKDRAETGHAAVLLAGDIIQFNTYNGDTGGTVWHRGVAKITEFDA